MESSPKERKEAFPEKTLEYYWELSGDRRIDQYRKGDNTAEFVIKKSDRVIFDFASLLPEGYKFITLDYYQGLPEVEQEKMKWLGWSNHTDQKVIQTEVFDSPRDILTLLHEIGHASQDPGSKERAVRLKLIQDYEPIYNPAGSKVTAPELYERLRDLEKKIVILTSRVERRAWAYAINTLRSLSKDTYLDFKELFPSLDSLKDYVYDCLASYRESCEWLTEGDPDFKREFRKLFDRSRWTRLEDDVFLDKFLQE